MSLTSPYLERKARVELVSLMDVMFLVLVFFVYATFDMAVHRGVKVDLPQATGTHETGERIIVTITAENALQLNGRPLEQSALVAEVARLVALKPELPVLLSGDRQAHLGTGLELLAALQSAGVKKASFQVSGTTPTAPQSSNQTGSQVSGTTPTAPLSPHARPVGVQRSDAIK